MTKITVEVAPDLARQIDRLVREGWYPDSSALVAEALAHFVESKSFLGDSPRMLHRFAADALNESKPETALKFLNRAMGLIAARELTDLPLYQSLVELKVQVLLILRRNPDALIALEEAKEKMPNNPGIAKWLQRVRALGA